jgi:hypothetical protein
VCVCVCVCVCVFVCLFVCCCRRNRAATAAEWRFMCFKSRNDYSPILVDTLLALGNVLVDLNELCLKHHPVCL